MEPTSFVAGDTVAWTKTIPSYPASAGWVLTYYLINAAGKITFSATAAGDDHAVALSAATSEGYIPGEYAWQAAVSKDGERYTVGTGRVTITPGFIAAASLDTRSPYRRALADMEKALADYHKAGQGHVIEIVGTQGNKMVFRSVPEIQEHIEWLKKQVAHENAMNALLSGHSAGRVRTRF